MRSIITRYHGPTNTRGSRIKATDSDHNYVTIPYDYAPTREQDHDEAALALCRKMKWHGTLIRGGTRTGNVYVWLADSERLEVK